jgi:hypothetical protein
VLKRQRTGSVLCTSCGVLVGVNDASCYNCGRRNPASGAGRRRCARWAAILGFTPFIIGACVAIYVLSWALSGAPFGGMLAPSRPVLNYLGMSGAIRCSAGALAHRC